MAAAQRSHYFNGVEAASPGALASQLCFTRSNKYSCWGEAVHDHQAGITSLGQQDKQTADMISN